MARRPPQRTPVREVTPLVEEGLALARSMEDEEALGFFTDVKRTLTEGGE